MAGLYHFTTRDPGGHKRYEREELARWAADRFHVEFEPRRSEKQTARRNPRAFGRAQPGVHRGPAAAMDEAHAWLGADFPPDAPVDQALRTANEDGRLKKLSEWLAEKYRYELSPEEMLRCDAERLERHLVAAVEEKSARKCGKMERALVLQLLDAAWKDHLLAMDHLRSSVGLRGYAQVDPKVEYKREGMKIFEQMWTSVGERDDRLGVPHGAARRGLRRLDVEGIGGDPRGRPIGRRDRRAAAGGHRRHRNRPQAAAHPQPPTARRPQRSLSLRQREEVQELLHEESEAGVHDGSIGKFDEIDTAGENLCGNFHSKLLP